jgi:hephaestin
VHVEVGDRLRVVLRNNAGTLGNVSFAADFLVPRGGSPKHVAFGETDMWEFDVIEDSGPVEGAYTDSVMHYYSSSVDTKGSLYAGLLGPLIVTRKGAADASGKPTDVDNELVTVLFVHDENASPYAEVNAKRAELAKGETVDEEANVKYAINGMVYCNLKGLDMELGKKTRWYAAAVGNEADVHTLHWHGNVALTSDGLHADSVRLLSHSIYPVTFTPNNPGRWLMHCHVGSHQNEGMLALYNVAGDPVAAGLESGEPTRLRHYYIRAEDDVWDYTPRAENVCDGTPFGTDENVFVEEGRKIEDQGKVVGYSVGSKYLKSRFFEYTDETFSEKVPRNGVDAYLGIVGPVLRVRVGEAIVVHLHNKASTRVSIHPHGLFYAKDSEGAPYNDGTSGNDRLDDDVPPGGKVEVLWEANRDAGPGPGEKKDSKLWIYHSHKVSFRWYSQ